jgi:hypothetical protein
MLRKLCRDDEKGLKTLHPNLVKNREHNHKMGTEDFRVHREQSVKEHFHDKKNRDVHKDWKMPYSNTSNFELSHNHTSPDRSVTSHDYCTYVYPYNQTQERLKELKESNVSKPAAYPSTFKLSGSLVDRDPKLVRIAERSYANTSKKDLLKSKFELSQNKEMRHKSTYGETYDLGTQQKSILPDISFKHRLRSYNIITGGEQYRDKGSFAHHKYEFYDPEVTNKRHSYNRNEMAGVNPRINPITGREIK